MTETCNNNTVCVWQDCEDEDNTGEPAILVKGYTGILELNQNGNEVLINFESMEEIIKAMRAMKKQIEK
jgi:hypothetical protein